MVVVSLNGGVYIVRRLILSKNFQVTCLYIYICISFGQSIFFIVRHLFQKTMIFLKCKTIARLCILS